MAKMKGLNYFGSPSQNTFFLGEAMQISEGILHSFKSTLDDYSLDGIGAKFHKDKVDSDILIPLNGLSKRASARMTAHYFLAFGCRNSLEDA